MTTRQQCAHEASDIPRHRPSSVLGVSTLAINDFEQFLRESVGRDPFPPTYCATGEEPSSRGRKAMKRSLVLVLALGMLVTAGCAGMSARQQRALSGGAIGAAGGAATGAVTGGSPAVGAAVGGAAGATTGYFWDRLFGR